MYLFIYVGGAVGRLCSYTSRALGDKNPNTQRKGIPLEWGWFGFGRDKALARDRNHRQYRWGRVLWGYNDNALAVRWDTWDLPSWQPHENACRDLLVETTWSYFPARWSSVLPLGTAHLKWAVKMIASANLKMDSQETLRKGCPDCVCVCVVRVLSSECVCVNGCCW